jgi:hypothetical protein
MNSNSTAPTEPSRRSLSIVALVLNDRLDQAQRSHQESSSLLHSLRFALRTADCHGLPINGAEAIQLIRGLSTAVGRLRSLQWDLTFEMACLSRWLNQDGKHHVEPLASDGDEEEADRRQIRGVMRQWLLGTSPVDVHTDYRPKTQSMRQWLLEPPGPHHVEALKPWFWGAMLRAAPPRALARALMRSSNEQRWRPGLLRLDEASGRFVFMDMDMDTDMAGRSPNTLAERELWLRDTELAFARALELDDETLGLALHPPASEDAKKKAKDAKKKAKDAKDAANELGPLQAARALRSALKVHDGGAAHALSALVRAAWRITRARIDQRVSQLNDLERDGQRLANVVHRLSDLEIRIKRTSAVARNVRSAALRWLEGLGPGFPSLPRAYRQDHTFQYSIQQKRLESMLKAVRKLAGNISNTRPSRALQRRRVNRKLSRVQRTHLGNEVRRRVRAPQRGSGSITVSYADIAETSVIEDRGVLAVECPLHHLDSPRRLVDLCHEVAHGTLPERDRIFEPGALHPAIGMLTLRYARALDDVAPRSWTRARCEQFTVELLADIVALAVAGPCYAVSMLMLLLGRSRLGVDGGSQMDPMIRAAALWGGARALWFPMDNRDETMVLAKWDAHMEALFTAYSTFVTDEARPTRASKDVGQGIAPSPDERQRRAHPPEDRQLHREMVDEATRFVEGVLRRLPNIVEDGQFLFRRLSDSDEATKRTLRQLAKDVCARADEIPDRPWLGESAGSASDAGISDLNHFAALPKSEPDSERDRKLICANTLHVVWLAWLRRQLHWFEADPEALVFARSPDRPLILYLAVAAKQAEERAKRPAGEAQPDNAATEYYGIGEPLELVFADKHGASTRPSAPEGWLRSAAAAPGATWFAHVVGTMDFVAFRTVDHVRHLLRPLIEHPPVARGDEAAYIRWMSLEWLSHQEKPTDEGAPGPSPTRQAKLEQALGGDRSDEHPPFLFLTQFPAERPREQDDKPAHNKSTPGVGGVQLNTWLNDRFPRDVNDRSPQAVNARRHIGTCRMFTWAEFGVLWEPNIWVGSALDSLFPQQGNDVPGTETTTLIRWTQLMRALERTYLSSIPSAGKYRAAITKMLNENISEPRNDSSSWGPALCFSLRVWLNRKEKKMPEISKIEENWSKALSQLARPKPKGRCLYLRHELGDADVMGTLVLPDLTDRLKPERPEALHGFRDLPNPVWANSIAAWLFLVIHRALAEELGAFEIVTRLGTPAGGQRTAPTT